MNISVCLPIALNKSFDYSVPAELESRVKAGLRVKVPFGRASQTGYIVKLNTTPNLPKNIKLKAIEEILDDEVLFGAELFPLAHFIEQTYANTLGETLEVLLPSFINKKLILSYKAPPPADLPLFYGAGPMTNSQKAAIDAAENNQVTLFFGDTFTGKTETILNISHKVISNGGQILILVPDIIISDELIQSVEKKFGQHHIHMWHSKVPLSRRKFAAADIINGRPCIVIGTRSACLLPFKNLKLSVMFQEEDKAFKQEDNKPYYHSRDVLMERSRLINAKFIMVSASPSLETLLMVKKGAVKLTEFKDTLPGFDNKAQIITMPKNGPESKYISAQLQDSIRQNMLNGGQSLLIINRLGYSGAYACLNCRTFAKCKECGAILSRVQDGEDSLICRKCGNKESIKQTCPVCKNEIFRSFGGGTQAVVSDIYKIFPNARVFRLDSQTLKTKDSQGHFAADALSAGEADIVVGTNLALRIGMWNSNIRLAALLDADNELNSPDFRTAETFAQMLFNLKGRLNRIKDGKLIVQISKSEIFDFDLLRQNSYLKFAEAELEFRKEFNFPPYTKLVKILITAKNKKDLDTHSQIIINAINDAYSAFMQLEGPVSCGKTADNFHQQYLLIRSLDDAMLKGFIKTLVENKPTKQVLIKVLADPYNFM